MKTLNCFIGCIYLLILFAVNSFGATYYVSSSDVNASDANSGTAVSAPWKTMAKVNSVTFAGGDQILFKRGDIFYDSLSPKLPSNNLNLITFGSYGSGDLPVISGFKEITNWSHHSGGVWVANFADSISNLFADGKLMTIARYPNSGFLKIDMGSGFNGFYDADLNQPQNHWQGATCKIRTVNWKYETPRVQSSSGGNITFSAPTSDSPRVGYGYYLDNLFSELDIEGEWYQDIPNGKIYFFPPGGVNPGNLRIEGIVLKNGVYLSGLGPPRNYIRIQDLNISGFRYRGVEANLSNNTIINGCEISYTGKTGVRLSGSGELIDGNTFTDNFNVAIGGTLRDNSIISKNTLKRTGMIPGYGENGLGCYGMQIQGSINTTVENNVIDSTGYIGIASGNNMLVQNNVLDNINLVMNDGAGISINAADGAQIKYNIISNVFGNTEASGSPLVSAHGITFQNGVTKNILVQGNTVSFSRNDGIYVDNKKTSSNVKILDNVLYGNYITQISFTNYSETSPYPTSYDNVVKRNIFYCLNFKQICMEHQMSKSTVYADYGVFDSNYYCNPYSEFVVRRSIVNPYKTELYRLGSWKSKVFEDPDSRYSEFAFEQYRVTDTLDGKANLITNSTFNSGISGWMTYPSTSQIAPATHPLLDGGCMKNTFTANDTQALSTSNYFNLSAGSFYLFSVSSANDHSGDFNAWVRYPSGIPEPQHKKYFGFENNRREYSFIFEAAASGQTRMSIGQIDPDVIYVDNANLFKVSVARIDSTQMSKLFVNKTDFSKTFSLGGVDYKELNGSQVTGSIIVPAHSSRILVYEDPLFSKKLQLKAFIEGSYNSGLIVQDTVKVYLRNFDSPALIADSCKEVLNSQGNGSFTFPNATNGIKYYVVIRHRNSVETWSKYPVTFLANQVSYDFTSAGSQAYGNNMKLVNGKYCLFSGDVDQNGSVDAQDLALTDNDAFFYVTGYVNTDVTCDNTVDAVDLGIIDNNSFNFIGKVTP